MEPEVTLFVTGENLGKIVKLLIMQTFVSENSLDTLFYGLIVFPQKVLTV